MKIIMITIHKMKIMIMIIITRGPCTQRAHTSEKVAYYPHMFF